MLRRPYQNDIFEVYEAFACKAVELFNETGEAPHQLFAVVLDELTGGISGMMSVEQDVLRKYHEQSGSTDAIKPLVRLFLQDGSPLRDRLARQGQELPSLVVQVSNIWFALPDELDTPARDLIPPSERGNRQEGIAVFVHASAASYFGVCPIVDTPERHAVFGPLQSYPDGSLAPVGLVKQQEAGASTMLH